jgi:hypothetical protein
MQCCQWLLSAIRQIQRCRQICGEDQQHLPHAIGVGYNTAGRSLERACFIQRNGGDCLIERDERL